jgi:hypothetical protein
MALCKVTKTSEFDSLKKVTGFLGALSIAQSNPTEGLPLLGRNSDGTIDTKFNELIRKYGEVQGEKMWWKLRFALNDFESYHFSESEDGSTILMNDNEIHYVSPLGTESGLIDTRYDSSQAYRDLFNVTAKHLSKMQVIRLVDRMSANLGMSVIKEDNTTAKNHRNDAGWVDNLGVHINVDNVTVDTFVHELSHVWLYWLKMTNPGAYDTIMQKTIDHANNNPQLVQIVTSAYNLGTERFYEEYFSFVSGLHSINAVMKFINEDYGPDYAIENSEVIYVKLRGYIKDSYQNISPLFSNVTPGVKNLDLSIATFYDVLKAITDDFISGVQLYSPEEVSAINEALGQDKGVTLNPYLASKNLNLPPIQNVRDFGQYFIDKSIEETGLGYGIKNQRERAISIMRNLRQGKDPNILYTYYNHTRYNFIKTGNTEHLIDDIIDNLIKVIDENKIKVLSNLDTFLRTIGPNDKSDIEKFCDDNKLSTWNITDMLRVAGITVSNVVVMKYSEMKGHAKYGHLFHEDFTGINPYVIIHSNEDEKEIRISLLDLTAERLNTYNPDIDGINLLGNVNKNDFQYYREGGTLKNNNAGVRQAMVGMTALYMASKGVKFHTISTFNIPNLSMERSVVLDIGELFNNLKIVGMQPEIMSNVNSEEVKKLLTTKQLFEMDHSGSYLAQLKDYVFLNMGSDTKEKYLYNTFFGDRITPTSMKKGIHKRMMQLQNQYKNHTTELRNNKEYQLLSLANMELEGIPKGFFNTLEDIDPYQKLLGVTHTVPTFLQQFIKEMYDRASFISVNEVQDFQMRRKAILKKVYAQLKVKMLQNIENPLVVMASYITDASSSIFNHLYKEREVFVRIDGKLEKRKVRIPFELHYDKNDEETAQALRDKKITIEEVEFCKMIVDEVRKRAIENIVHENYMEGRDITFEEAETKYDLDRNSLTGGLNIRKEFIPVISKSSTDMIRTTFKKGKVLEGLKATGNKLLEDVLNEVNLFADAFGGVDLNEVGNKFKSQVNNINSVLDMCGMSLDDAGNIVIENMGKFNTISTNIEAATNYFMMSSARKESFETHFMPAYNSVHAAISAYNQFKGGDDELLTEIKSWLEEWKMINVDRRTKITQGKVMTKVLAGVEKTILKTYSTLVLGAYLPVGFKSIAFNEIQGVLNSVARNMAQIRGDKENMSHLFGVKEWGLATAIVLDPLIKHGMTKAFILARMFQLIDSSEYDIMQNPANVISKRYIASQQTLQMGNWLTDNFARVTSMVAQMLKDNSWDAYVYDEKTGYITYDVKKDGMYYNKDGTQKTENGEHVLLQEVYEENVRLKLQEANDTNTPKMGYRISDLKGMKLYADMWVVGAMTDDVRALVSYRMVLRSLSQFRIFSFARLARFGLTASSSNTILGTRYKAIKDDDGNWITEREQRYFETQLKSLGQFAKVCSSFKFKNIKAWYAEASEERRSNLMRASITLGVYALVFAIAAAFKPKDDPMSKYMAKKHNNYKWLYQDLIDVASVLEVYKSPIPAVTWFTDLYGVIFDSDPAYRLFRYMPGLNTANKYNMIYSQEEKDRMDYEAARKRKMKKLGIEVPEENDNEE